MLHVHSIAEGVNSRPDSRSHVAEQLSLHADSGSAKVQTFGDAPGMLSVYLLVCTVLQYHFC